MSFKNLPPSKVESTSAEGSSKMPERQGKSSMPPPPAVLSATRLPKGQGADATQPSKLDGEPDLATDMDYLSFMGERKSGQIATQGAGDGDAFSANDVNQGSIGDCFLLAALMALADTRPDILRNAIKGPKPDGSYDVRIYTGFSDDPSVPLVPKVVNVTSRFYTNKRSYTVAGVVMDVDEPGELTGARGGDRDGAGNEELWVKLIEKALAVEVGNYDELDQGGFPAHVLEALTGEQQQEFWFNGVHAGTKRNTTHVLNVKMDDEELRSFVRRNLSQDVPIATTTYESAMMPSDPASLAERDRFSISSLHAYSVLQADEDSIVLRNPYNRAVGDAAQIDLTWQQFRKYFKELSTASGANS